MPITTTPSGPQGEFSTYTPIAANTVTGSAAASYTFNNIPSTYTDLVCVINGTTTSLEDIQVQYNGDTDSNYSTTFIYSDSSAVSGRQSNQTQNTLGSLGTVQGQTIFQFMNYNNTTTFKTALSRAGISNWAVFAKVGLWRSTAPINSIKFAHPYSFSVGTTFTLYGIKAAAPAPKATGGDVITTDGTYWYHAFKSTGVFSLTPAVSSLTANVLVIAGGGGGGFGGGGAGGLRYFTSQSITASSSTVVVGGGGASDTVGKNGSNGNNSQFAALTLSTGGGGGGSILGGDGGNGGSGGGGGSADNSAGSGGSASPAGQGSAGGSGATRNAGTGGGGGGGGIGGGGTNATVNGGGGNGGNGVDTYSAFATATATGVSGFYAGGGGGSANLNARGVGGTGGGGNGYKGTGPVAGSAGVSNTGGGGGGIYNTTIPYHGGSGLVIVRYPV